MMDALCPQGHPSATNDYCDQCGTPMTVGAAATSGEPEISSVTEVRSAEVPAERCPACDTPRIPGDRYCEVDGYDFEGGDASVVVWCAVVRADRTRFDALDPDDLTFPHDAPTFTCALEGESVSVGRRSPSRDIVPDIDLGGQYEDPGVSRRHLRFDRLPDGTYAAVDCGSANGTTINDEHTRLEPEQPVPLADGDRVHVGAWTTITVVRRADGA